MTRAKLQSWMLVAAVVVLLVVVANIYQTFLAKAPPNLEGNIATEGGPTANPPGN